MKILRPLLACCLLAGSASADIAVLAKDAHFVKEQVTGGSGNPVAGRVVPAGSIVAVIQDGGPSLFVAHQRDFMWVDRSFFVGGRCLRDTDIYEKKLLQKVEFRDTSKSGLASRITAPAGAKVQVLIDDGESCLVKYKNVVGRVNSAVFSEAVSFMSAVTATTTLDDRSADANPPADEKVFQSAISPNLRIKELVPLDITARVTSIAYYPEPRQSANAWDPNTIAPADFTLAWGPFLMEPTFKSRQGDRRNSFSYRCPLPKGMNPSHFAHNFHLVYDSKEIRAKIMQCQPGYFVSMRGSLVSVLAAEHFPTKSAWTSSLTAAYCYIFLVRELEIHGQSVPTASTGQPLTGSGVAITASGGSPSSSPAAAR